MRLLGVMAIAAIALSNVLLSACSEDDDLEMNSSTLAKGLMTRSGEGGTVYKGLLCQSGTYGKTEYVKFGKDFIPVKYSVSWREGNFPMSLYPNTSVVIDDPDYSEKYTITYEDLFRPHWEGCSFNVRYYIKGYIKYDSDSIDITSWDVINVDIDEFKLSDENDNY